MCSNDGTACQAARLLSALVEALPKCWVCRAPATCYVKDRPTAYCDTHAAEWRASHNGITVDVPHAVPLRAAQRLIVAKPETGST